MDAEKMPNGAAPPGGSTMPLPYWERNALPGDALYKAVAKGKEGAVPAFFSYCCCNFDMCGPGLGACPSSIGPAVEGLLGVTDWSKTGTVPWKNPWFEFWGDPVLCLMACLPCTGFSVGSRTLAGMAGDTCEARCLQMWLLNYICLGPCQHAQMRTQFRAKYNLAGSKGEDCVLSFCCCTAPCLGCQEARELAVHTPYAVPFTNTGDVASLLKNPNPAVVAETAPKVDEMKRDGDGAVPVPVEAAAPITAPPPAPVVP